MSAISYILRLYIDISSCVFSFAFWFSFQNYQNLALRIFSNTKEYEELRKKGVKEAQMLKQYRKAWQYQGCFSRSHWGGAREREHWDLLIQHAPNLSKKIHEVPNSLRPTLGIMVSRFYSWLKNIKHVDVFFVCIGIV